MIHNQIFHNTVRTAVLLFVLMLTTASAWAWSGNGTDADPYLIASYNDLLTLRNNVNGGEAYDDKYFKQTADIDWPANTTWTSGIGTDADHRFGGHYDGDGKAIRHLTISGTSTYTGLFGYVRGASYGYGYFKKTTLMNIVLEDCNIDASSVSGSYAAGICAIIPNYTLVDNCRVSGTISGTSHASGITCTCEHTLISVTNCFADVTVSASTKGKIFAETPYSAHIVGNYYHDNGDGVGSTNSSHGLTASEAAPLYTVSGSGFTTAATNATITHAGKHYFASGATVTLTTDVNNIITGTPAVSGTGASVSSVATDKKSITVTVGSADVTVSVCSGTENDPYLIASYDDLLALRNNVNGGEAYDGKYFKQTADIDWPANTTWTSGIGTYADHRFGGHYDGDGKAIRRLAISGTSTYIGLFGYVRGASNGKGGFYSTTLKNIVLEDCNIQTTGNYAAGILAVAYSENTVENCRVSGTIKGNKAAGGIVGYENQGKVKNCFADVTVTASVQTGYNASGQFQYYTVGKIIGYVVALSSGDVTGNYYHDDGATDGAGHAVTAIGRGSSTTYSDDGRATPLYTVGSTNLTAAATNATVTHAGTHYFAAGATATLTTDGNNLISGTPTVSGTGASVSSVATDKKSITVTVGTADVTVTATLQTITGPCGTNATWRMSDTNGDGIYETLTIRGTGAITSSPWDADFAATIQRVNIGRTDLTISGNPFSTLADGAVIAVPTPAYAIGYSSAAYASKMHVGVGTQLFTAIGTVDDAACEIATEADLRNLATAVNQDDQYCSGLTFRQTAPITLNGDIAPIGIFGSAYFGGTYDGGGNTISGLSISGDYHRAGLFGYVTDGTVKNVGLVSPVVTSSYKNGDSGAIVGAIAGRAYSAHIENCWVYNPTVSATGSGTNYVGAIVGMSTGNKYTNLYFYDSDNSHSYAAVGYITDNPSLTNVSRAYALTLGSGVTTSTTPAFSYNNVSYYVGTVTLDAPAGWVYVYTVNGTPIDGTSFTISGNSTVACTKSINSADFEQTATNEYIIHTAAGWSVFCDCLNDNDTWNRFSGKTVKLDANIAVSRMAGSDSHDFCGTFDGQGYTLTFNYGTSGTPANVQYVAPFSYVSNTKANTNDAADSPAKIMNLHVAGDIYTSAKYAAGIVGQHWGTLNIENCRSSIVIHSSVVNNDGNDGTHGGFEAVSRGVLNITGCVFDGKQITTATNSTGNCAGFIAWGNGSISNCLYAPTTIGTGETEVVAGTGDYPSGTFYRGSAPTVTNSYYTRTLGTAQGTAPRTIEAGEGITVSNIALTGTTTAYTTSGITAYSGGGLSYAGNIYYGSGDAVSLAISGSPAEAAPLGYQYNGYTASAGTLSGSTLTMPDGNVTINAAVLSDGQPHSISYMGADGVVDTHDAIALDETMTNLSADQWYYVGKDIDYTETVTLGSGDVTLVLGANKTMNVGTTQNKVSGDGLQGTGCNLTVYGQTLNDATAGNLSINTSGENSMGIKVRQYYQNSGTVTIRSSYQGIFCAYAPFSLFGGKCDVSSDNMGIRGYGLKICGGKLDVIGGDGDDCYGVNSGASSIELGFRNATDYIHIDKIYNVYSVNTIGVVNGQSLKDESDNVYSGYHEASDKDNFITAINGKTLVPYRVLIEMNEHGIRTYASTSALDLSGVEGLTAYIASSCVKNNGYSQLTMSPVTKVPAVTGLLLKAQKGAQSKTYEVPLLTTDADDVSSNMLVGLTEMTEVPTSRFIQVGEEGGDYYFTFILANGEHGINWYALAQEGNFTPTLKANSAYLLLPNDMVPNASRALTMAFEETTGISEMRNEEGEMRNVNDGAGWYTIDGVKLDKTPIRKGLYIFNGHKIVIK